MVVCQSASIEFATSNNEFRLRLQYHQEYEPEENYSNVYIDGLQMLSTYPTGQQYFADGKIYINDTVVKTMSSIGGESNTYVAQTNVWYSFEDIQGQKLRIPHNDDGTQSITIGLGGNNWAFCRFWTATGAGGSGWGTAQESKVDLTVKLTTIPRKSSLTVPTFTMGSAGTITINRKSTTFTHTITFSFGSVKGTIATKTASGTVSWTPSKELAKVVPNDVSGSGSMQCDTYNADGELVGTTSVTFKANVPNDIVPTVTAFTATRVNNSVPSSWGIYVKDKSQCTLAATASGAYDSSIKSYSIKQGDVVIASSASTTTNVLTTAGNITFTVTVTDSRNRTATKTVTINVLDYFNPTVTEILSQRCIQNGTLNDEGLYIRTICTLTFASCSGKNSASATVAYRKQGDSNWSSALAITTQTAKVIAGNANIDYSYEVKYTITDAFTTTTVIDVVSTSFTTMDFKKGGKGVSFGKACEEDYVVEIAPVMDFKVYGHSLRDLFYPVGSVYISVNNTNPATIFGGTWEQIKDTFLLSAGDTYTAGSTGGEATHTLSVDELPSHTHDIRTGSPNGYVYPRYVSFKGGDGSAVNVLEAFNANSGGAYDIHNENTGGGKAHNNLPPYLVVYMWKRTA